MFTLEHDGQKSAPQSEKWRGHWPPTPMVPLPMMTDDAITRG